MLKYTKRKITLILISVLLIIAAPLYLGCGQNCGTSKDNPNQQFSEGEELTIYVGQSYSFIINTSDFYIEVPATDTAIKLDGSNTITGVHPGMVTVYLYPSASSNSVKSELDTIDVHVVEPKKEDLVEQYSNFPTAISVEVGQTNTEISDALPADESPVFSVVDSGTATVSEDGTVTGVAKGITAVAVVIYNRAEPSICYAADVAVEVTETETEQQDTDEDDAPPTEDDTETTGNNIVYLASYSGTTAAHNSIMLQAYDGMFVGDYVPRAFDPSELSFSSNDTSVATVNANGIITGVSAGTTTINVTKGLFADSNPITRYRVTVYDLSQFTVRLPAYVNVYLDNPRYLYPLTVNELGGYRVSSVSSYNNPGTTGGLTDLSIADNVGGQLLSFTATNVGEVMIQFNLSLSGTNISIPYHLIVNVKETTPVQPTPTPTPAPAPEEDDAMTPEDEAGTP